LKTSSRRPSSTKQTPRRTRRPAATGEAEGHVEFRLSKRTTVVIDAALHGLTKAQQERVLAAIDRVGEEAGIKVGRWVENNVIDNANELLAFLAPGLAGEGRWDDLRAISRFLARLDVPVDHQRLAAALEKEGKPGLADQYRQLAAQL
jgi:hypothetical protein